MTLSSISFSAFGQAEFWIGVGVLAGIYGIFVLGLQLNEAEFGHGGSPSSSWVPGSRRITDTADWR